MVTFWKVVILLLIGGAIGYLAGIYIGPVQGVLAFILFAVLTHRRVFYRIHRRDTR